MKQKLKDILLVLQGQRKGKVFLALFALAAIFLLTYSPRQVGTGTKKKNPVKESAGGTSAKEGIEDVIKGVVKDQLETKVQLNNINSMLEQNATRMRNYEDRTAEIFKKILEKMAESQPGSNSTSGGTGPVSVSGAVSPENAPVPSEDVQPGRVGGASNVEEPSAYAGGGAVGGGAVGAVASVGELEPFGGVDQKEVVPPAISESARRVAFVGVGDSVRVKLLSGVNAPTDGTPYPVVLQLVSDVHGPDGSTLPLGEARMVAAVQGSISDSRALFRLTELNVAMPNGQRKAIKVDGWIVGEDGMKGLQGRLIDTLGQQIAAAGLAGLIGGAGTAMSESNTTTEFFNNGGSRTTIDGNTGQYALGKAGASAARVYENIIRDRAQKMVPLVQVYSGREGTAIFSQSFTVNGLFEALEDQNTDESYQD